MWRDGLWKKLLDIGVKGKLWRVIRGLYSKVESCVRVNGEMTDLFEMQV